MEFLAQQIHRALGLCRRILGMYHPFGLGRLGIGSAIHTPRVLWGRKNIRIGKKVLILENSFIQAIPKYANQAFHGFIDIGDNVYIGRNVYLTAIQGITIGEGSVLSEHVYITDLSHGFDPEAGPIMKQPVSSKGPVEIGRNCFLGYRVTVMPGVRLGDWCIVGANSVVTHDFPAYSMVAGTPAKLVKAYSKELKQWVGLEKARECGLERN